MSQKQVHASSSVLVVNTPTSVPSHPGAASAALVNGNQGVTLARVVNVISKVYKLYGWRGEDSGRIENNLKTHITQLTKVTGDWIKVVKYKLAAFFSFHLDQPIPESPFPPHMDNPAFLLGGSACRWLKEVKRRAERRTVKDCTFFRSFLETLLQSRKAMERPDSQYVVSKVSEAVKELTAPKDPLPDKELVPLWGDRAELGDKIISKLDAETMKSQLRRTVREVLGDSKYTLKDRLKAFFPSTSSNYINSRSGAGAVGTIMEDKDLLDGLRTKGGSIKVSEDSDSEEQIHDQTQRFEYDSSDLRSRFSKLWFRILKKARTEAKIVKAVGLPEALKVRTITKGPPLTYTSLRPLWKKLHTILRKQKTFMFIGTPDSEAGMLQVLGRSLLEGQVYLSGDYAGATNNLFSWVSETIAEEISDCWGLTDTERTLFLSALTGHIFDDDGKYLDQKMGQLMGSIVSFPILCIANAAMSRWAMELGDKRVWHLRDAPLAINGDDVALRSAKATYAFWSSITEFGGLIESVGKTFVSPLWVSINSRMYERVDPFPLEFKNQDGEYVTRQATLKQVPHVNMGLLMGLKRSGREAFNSRDIDEGVSFSTRAKDLIDSCPTFLKNKVYSDFLVNNREELEKTRLPWYIPEWLGGLGLPILDPEEQFNSSLDKKIALRIIRNWSHPSQRPICLGKSMTPWKVRRLVKKKLPDTHSTLVEDESVAALERIEGLLAIDLLFNSDFELSDLYNENGDIVNSQAAINHNSRLWNPKGIGNKKMTNLRGEAPDSVIFGPRRYTGLTVHDLASDNQRFPLRTAEPPTVKEVLRSIDRAFYDLD